jgi:peptidoglycan/xylan/chitin deacetylase (PgdA/CDA1 family)
MTTLAVLAYHKVGNPPPASWETWYLIPETTFRGQLAELRDAGWRAIGLAELVAGLDEPGSLPERAALITFDDGYRSTGNAALRGLEDFGYPAVVFVPTDYIGGHNSFDAGTDEPEEPLCGLADLRALERRGISVQSHCASHRSLSALGPSEREDELARSKAALEAGLGRPVTAVSYPYGDPGPEPLDETLVRLGYRAGFLYGGGPVALGEADRYRLPRIAMGPDTDLAAELAAA